MAQVIQVPYSYEVVLPVTVAQAVQSNYPNPISLEALGLLTNLLSYPSKWELHKSELYKRYAKNKEHSVRSAWKDLMASGYIIEFKYWLGRNPEYVYYLRKVPFSPEEKAQILDNARIEFGEITRLDFQVLKNKTRKPHVNQIPLLNQNPLLNQEPLNNKENSENNKSSEFDDDKRTSSAKHNEQHLNSIISALREATKDEMNERSFRAVLKKVIDKYNQGKIGEGRFRDYFVTSLINKMDDLHERRVKEQGKERMAQDKINARNNRVEKAEPTNNVPIYNWLEC